MTSSSESLFSFFRRKRRMSRETALALIADARYWQAAYDRSQTRHGWLREEAWNALVAYEDAVELDAAATQHATARSAAWQLCARAHQGLRSALEEPLSATTSDRAQAVAPREGSVSDAC